MGNLREYLCTFMIVSCLIFLKMKNVSDKICREYQKTRFSSITFFRELWRLWYNVEKYGRAEQDTSEKTHMRFARWITKATDTH